MQSIDSNMHSIRYFIPLFALVLLTSLVAFSGVIREGSLRAGSEGSVITLHWISEDEGGVLRYEVERKVGNAEEFMPLDQVVLKGNNATYTYVDNSAFLRTTETLYQYRIKVQFADGTSMYYGPISVIPNISSVRQTWGSIKAMFR
jgi:hypothetical protein